MKFKKKKNSISFCFILSPTCFFSPNNKTSCCTLFSLLIAPSKLPSPTNILSTNTHLLSLPFFNFPFPTSLFMYSISSPISISTPTHTNTFFSLFLPPSSSPAYIHTHLVNYFHTAFILFPFFPHQYQRNPATHLTHRSPYNTAIPMSICTFTRHFEFGQRINKCFDSIA